jgi:hypothetical protein
VSIPLAILGIVAYALYVNVRPEEGRNSSVRPMVFMIGGVVVLLLMVVLLFDALAARSARHTLKSEGQAPAAEHAWKPWSAGDAGAEIGPDVGGVDRIRQAISSVANRQSKY